MQTPEAVPNAELAHPTPAAPDLPEATRGLFLNVGRYFIRLESDAAVALLSALIDSKVYREEYDPRDGRFDSYLVEDTNEGVAIAAATRALLTPAEFYWLRAHADDLRDSNRSAAAPVVQS